MMIIFGIIILIIASIGVTILIHKFGIISSSARKIIIVIVTVLGLLAVAVPSLLLLFMDSIRIPAPPLPEITYGEFPFRLEYEIDGERYIIEDTLIAEFIRSSEGSATSQARRVWRSRLESNNENRFILKRTDDVTISFSPGLAEYYMGDLGRGESTEPNRPILFQPSIAVRTVNENVPNVDYILLEEAQEILSEYGILLISWDLAEPIVNSFS